MAQIISLKRSNSKTAHKQSTIAAEYNMDEQFFRLWTYKQTDSSRTEGAKQIITLDKRWQDSCVMS